MLNCALATPRLRPAAGVSSFIDSFSSVLATTSPGGTFRLVTGDTSLGLAMTGTSLLLFTLEPCTILQPHVHPHPELAFPISGNVTFSVIYNNNSFTGAVENTRLDVAPGGYALFPTGPPSLVPGGGASGGGRCVIRRAIPPAQECRPLAAVPSAPPLLPAPATPVHPRRRAAHHSERGVRDCHHPGAVHRARPAGHVLSANYGQHAGQHPGLLLWGQGHQGGYHPAQPHHGTPRGLLLPQRLTARHSAPRHGRGLAAAAAHTRLHPTLPVVHPLSMRPFATRGSAGC